MDIHMESNDRLRPCKHAPSDKPCTSLTPEATSLPHLCEDYQKSLHELKKAADRASSSSSKSHSCVEEFHHHRLPKALPQQQARHSTKSLSVAPTEDCCLQRFKRCKDWLTKLQLVKVPSPTTTVTIEIENDEKANNFSLTTDFLNSSEGTGSSMFQSRPGTGASSSLASVDVEGFISRFSETLASQVLALVHKALPGKPT